MSTRDLAIEEIAQTKLAVFVAVLAGTGLPTAFALLGPMKTVCSAKDISAQ